MGGLEHANVCFFFLQPEKKRSCRIAGVGWVGVDDGAVEEKGLARRSVGADEVFAVLDDCPVAYKRGGVLGVDPPVGLVKAGILRLADVGGLGPAYVL